MEVNVEKITKEFQDKEVIRELSMKLKPGKIVGLLGPNGAGKTTTLRIVLNILHPDSGQILFDGHRMNKKIRNKIGYLPEERGLYQKYSVIDVLRYFGRLKGLSTRKSQVEAVRLLDRFQMIEYLEEPIGHLSKGTQQRLQFLVCFIHNPDFLILDEPFWGLDPLNQEVLRNRMKDFKDEGKTILLSTHQLIEAETLCDYFILIDGGETVLKGSLDEIRKNFHLNIIAVEAHQNPSVLQDIPKVNKVEIKDSMAHLYVDENAPIKAIMQEIIKKVDLSKMEFYKPSLNDIFLQTIKSRKK
jgi:ABC-2 type transport system ATP-binding protein